MYRNIKQYAERDGCAWLHGEAQSKCFYHGGVVFLDINERVSDFYYSQSIKSSERVAVLIIYRNKGNNREKNNIT
ncbi:hypothetical protein SAMN02745127_03135 [Oceanospirillum multiglobuliferum]|nr:hypothetical protein SAMN02745127_03135 [Oceanospirillum multiglobuliferum]